MHKALQLLISWSMVHSRQAPAIDGDEGQKDLRVLFAQNHRLPYGPLERQLGTLSYICTPGCKAPYQACNPVIRI